MCNAESLLCAVDDAKPAGTLGGACFGNGQCYDGLVCDGTVCVEDNGIPTGTLGGACYPNGTCLSSDLHCVDSTCQVLEARVGTVGGACYDNGTCNPGLACEGGACVEDDTIPVGTNGGDCLPNGTCWAGLLCNGTTCEPDTRLEVGTVGAACFPNGTCNAGLECIVTVASGESSAECAVEEPIAYGTLDNPCYPNNTCNGGLVCDLGTCVPSGTQVTEPPGAVGGLCFPNGTCNDGNVCNSFGFCEEIVAGGLYGACLQGGGCNLGLSCYDTDGNGEGDECLPTVEHLGSIHGVVTDYVDNARLEGVQVTLIHEGRVLTSTTDSLGYYHFDNLKPGHFEITFDKLDGSHTMRRLRDTLVACPIMYLHNEDIGFLDLQDQECNQRHDIDLFPFSGTQHGRIWYLNDQEVTPAAGVTVIADFSDLCGCTDDSCFEQVQECEGENCNGPSALPIDLPIDEFHQWLEDHLQVLSGCYSPVDISPDRFIAVTDEDGRFHFTDLPNTGKIGVNITVMPSVFNGFDYESWGPAFRRLDVFGEDNVEVFLTPQYDPPFIVANNWEDYLYGGFDVSEPIEMTFSRSMKTEGCDIHLSAGGKAVSGTLEWSNDNTTATFTPHHALTTGKKYAVHIMHCESALDDQEYTWLTDELGYGGGDLCCGIDGTACHNSENNRTDFTTQDGMHCSYSPGCFGPDDNFEIECDMAPNLEDSEFELYRVVRYPGHAESNPNRVDGNAVLVPVSFTASVDGNTVIVDPTESLDPSGEYEFAYDVASFIEGDSEDGNDTVVGVGDGGFCKDTETIEFVFANLPVVTRSGDDNTTVPVETSYKWLETTDVAQNVVMTFTKDVNLALSFVTLENDDAVNPEKPAEQGNSGDDPVDHYSQFGLILDSTITADGAVITINPTADLEIGGRYTVRYVVAAADGLGVAVGHFTFDVVPAPACIAFVEDNLGDRANVNYTKPVWLHFSTGVNSNDERNIIKLTDEFGGEWWPTFSTDSYTNDDDVVIPNGRVVVSHPQGNYSPDRDYTITFKIYAEASRQHVWVGADEAQEIYPNGDGGFCGGTEHGIYTQDTVTFTTEGHITLASTTVGTYADSNKDGFYNADSNGKGLQNCQFTRDSQGNLTKINCGDFQGSTSFAVNGAISLTFTETPDLAVYHAANFARLYRFTGANGSETDKAKYDLVATTNTLSGNTITMALLPQQTLQSPGSLYCIGYQVTSNIVIGGNADESEAVGGLSSSGAGDADDPVVGEGVVPQLCFSTAGTPPAAPPTAPTAAPQLVLVNLVDGDDIAVTLRHSVLQGATAGTVGGGTRWYEYYVSAEEGDINDYLLWTTVEDCQQTIGDDCVAPNVVLGLGPNGETRAGLAVLGQDVFDFVCNETSSPNAPVYCKDGLPFNEGDSVFFRVRACTGSVDSDVTPLCGPYSAALEVSDLIPPDLTVYVLGSNGDENLTIYGEGADDNTSCSTADGNEALTFNVFGYANLSVNISNVVAPASSREPLGGVTSIAVRQKNSSAALAGITCAPLQSSKEGGSTDKPADADTLYDTPPAAYTAYAPTWWQGNATADSWPDWGTDATGLNAKWVKAYDYKLKKWAWYPPKSLVTFKCTVNAGLNPVYESPGGLDSTINISAGDTSGNPKNASMLLPVGEHICGQ